MAVTDTWPDWADYRATDANGAVYFYAKKPDRLSVIWHADCQRDQDTTVVPNWRDSLEERER